MSARLVRWSGEAVRPSLAFAIAALAFAPASASACTAKVNTPGFPLVVGDSVTVAAAGPLRARGFAVNARVCRQITEGLGIMRATRRRETVLALGSNGKLTMTDLRAAKRLTGRLVLVTPSGVVDGDQRRMRSFARQYPSVGLVPWDRLSRATPGLLAPDGLHLTAKGARAFAAAIAGST